MTKNKLKFPYAISDFYSLITEGYFYIDRTNLIPLLEEADKYLLFLRPRRFGKSLLISMLKNYYDVAIADEFEELFGHLAIGQEPTANHNQYFVLDFDFSMVNPHGTAQDIQQSLYNHINNAIETFRLRYKDFIPSPITINADDGLDSMQSVFGAVSQTKHKLYILIDEYDNFANEVLMGQGDTNPSRYEALVHGEGCLKSVLKTIKGGTKGLGVDRVFITGVSPIAMSDVTSGFNIATDIYLNPRFNELCGFTEDEVKMLLEKVADVCDFNPTEVNTALAMMRSFYNGYAFCYNKKPNLYNPTLALYFLKHWQSFCEYPYDMLDENMSTDRNKLMYISRLSNGGALISKALNQQKVLSIQKLGNRFGIKDMLYGAKDTPFMLSLLYYLGMLTLAERAPTGKLILQIPNLVAQQLYAERLQNLLLPNKNNDDLLATTEDFYHKANMQGVCDFIEQNYFRVFDNRDYRWTDELNIKTIFLTMLFNDTFYIMDSEKALQRTYADLVMIIRPDMRQYQLFDFLIEFKYLKLSDLGLSATDLKEKPNADLMTLDLVQQAFTDAKTQLKGYRTTLQQAYNNTLRLHTFSVVALGYDRLLWKKL